MRKLKLKINDKDYTLEMNRSSIKWLEAHGFSIADFEAKPLTYYDLLWTSLFGANHKDVNPNLAIKLLEKRDELLKPLNDFVDELMSEIESGKELSEILK